MDSPAELMCPICRTLLKNAVQIPCCHTCCCRGCAIKKLMVSKKKCWVKSSKDCEDNIIQLDQLTPAEEARRLVEDFKGGGTLYKDRKLDKTEDEKDEQEIVEEPSLDLLTPSSLVENIVIKKEPGLEDDGSKFGDIDLSTKIAQKSAELRAKLEQCKLSSGISLESTIDTKVKTQSSQMETDTQSVGKETEQQSLSKETEHHSSDKNTPQQSSDMEIEQQSSCTPCELSIDSAQTSKIVDKQILEELKKVGCHSQKESNEVSGQCQEQPKKVDGQSQEETKKVNGQSREEPKKVGKSRDESKKFKKQSHDDVKKKHTLNQDDHKKDQKQSQNDIVKEQKQSKDEINNIHRQREGNAKIVDTDIQEEKSGKDLFQKEISELNDITLPSAITQNFSPESKDEDGDNYDNEEEYGEGSNRTNSIFGQPMEVDLNSVKTESANDLPSIKKESDCFSSIKTELLEDESNIHFTSPPYFSAPNSVESTESSLQGAGHFSPKKEPGLCTPTSSGYWSDDSKEGPFFGKLTWDSGRKSDGFVEIVLDSCETRRVPVSRYDVKCGAETGDLVEFVLGADAIPDVDGRMVRPAKKVKLVEKGLPVNEADQIRGQDDLKRNLEYSAGLHDRNDGGLAKKIKTESEDTVIDVRAELNSFCDFADIADVSEEELVMKTERDYDDIEDEELYDHCICDKKMMIRCQLCPFYFLESRATHCLLEGESVTFMAKVNGNVGDIKQELSVVRHLPFPFKYLNQPSFDLIRSIGRKSLETKVTPVFYHDHVFITVTNSNKKQVNINPGDVLGICQAHKVPRSQVSSHFVLEPPDRQNNFKHIPVYVTKDDFTTDEKGTVCGFGSLGTGDMNYKHCLVRVELSPDIGRKFKLSKSEVTVQIKQNIWLELEPRKFGGSSRMFERALPSDKCIGLATSIMVDETVIEGLKKSAEEKIRQHKKWMKENNIPDFQDNIKLSKEEKIEEDPKADQNAYEDMLMQIDQDMKVNEANSSSSKLKVDDSLLSKIFKGVVRENLLIIPPGATIETNLFLAEEDNINLKSLLKFKARVTNNEEFKYYNNCYNIEEQIVTIVNSICKLSKTTKPAIKVKISNPRSENACLKRDSAIALVKIHLDNGTRKPPESNESGSIVPPPPPSPSKSKPVAPVRRKLFDPVKHLERMERKCARKWEQIISEKTFERSIEIEKKYPYFDAATKPKIPFGLKDKELNIRFGVNQDSRPVKMIDRINGVFTCTICDSFVVLDRYSLQDHWYSAGHKRNMKLVQVIAGPEERLYMNRPFVVEQLEQFTLSPLLGLDHLMEVLREKQEPMYHCALCNLDSSLTELVPHLTSVQHILSFMKEFFPTAWSRFSSIPEPSTWAEVDFECLDQVVVKIDSVHGKKRPTMVQSQDKLEEHVDKIPLNSYTTRRKELDKFFKSLKPSEPSQISVKPVKTVSRPAALKETVDLPPGSMSVVEFRLLSPGSGALKGQWVHISLNPGVTCGAHVQTGFSKVWQEQQATLRLKLVNPSTTSTVSVPKNTPLVLVRWRM